MACNSLRSVCHRTKGTLPACTWWKPITHVNESVSHKATPPELVGILYSNQDLLLQSIAARSPDFVLLYTCLLTTCLLDLTYHPGVHVYMCDMRARTYMTSLTQFEFDLSSSLGMGSSIDPSFCVCHWVVQVRSMGFKPMLGISTADSTCRMMQGRSLPANYRLLTCLYTVRA